MIIRRLLAVSTLSLALSAGFAHAQTGPVALEWEDSFPPEIFEAA